MGIKYKKGYKYQLVEDYEVMVGIYPRENLHIDFISLTRNGKLSVDAGYAWDGPSGPTIDTKNFMRGSLVHDALYQLMRYGALAGKWRDEADEELEEICIEDGMSKIRAWLVHEGLKVGGGCAADPSNKKKIYTAP